MILSGGKEWTYVELRPIRRPGPMQRDHLGTQEVFTILDAAGDLDDLVTLIADHRVGAPAAAAEALLLDLKPNFMQVSSVLATGSGYSVFIATEHEPGVGSEIGIGR